MRKLLIDEQDDGIVWYVQKFEDEAKRWTWTRSMGFATVFTDEAELAAAFLALEGDRQELLGTLKIVDLASCPSA